MFIWMLLPNAFYHLLKRCLLLAVLTLIRVCFSFELHFRRAVFIFSVAPFFSPFSFEGDLAILNLWLVFLVFFVCFHFQIELKIWSIECNLRPNWSFDRSDKFSLDSIATGKFIRKFHSLNIAFVFVNWPKKKHFISDSVIKKKRIPSTWIHWKWEYILIFTKSMEKHTRPMPMKWNFLLPKKIRYNCTQNKRTASVRLGNVSSINDYHEFGMLPFQYYFCPNTEWNNELCCSICVLFVVSSPVPPFYFQFYSVLLLLLFSFILTIRFFFPLHSQFV